MAVGDPILYVLSTEGIMLLSTVPLILILSVGLSPRPISPSAVIFPVACKSPETVTLLCKLISSPPCGLILIGPVMDAIVFVEMYILLQFFCDYFHLKH